MLPKIEFAVAFSPSLALSRIARFPRLARPNSQGTLFRIWNAARTGETWCSLWSKGGRWLLGIAV